MTMAFYLVVINEIARAVGVVGELYIIYITCKAWYDHDDLIIALY